MSSKWAAFWTWFRWVLAVVGAVLFGLGAAAAARDVYLSATKAKVDGKGKRWVVNPADHRTILVDTGSGALEKVALPDGTTADQVAKVDVIAGPKVTVEVKNAGVKDRRAKP